MTRSPAEAPGAVRPSTAVDAIAERYVTRLAGLSPEFAVYNGLPGRRGELDDYSPEGLAALSDLDRSTLRELDGVEAADDVDRVTVAAMRERLGVGLDLADAGEDLRSLNNIDSPVQTLRDGFDNLPTATGEDWDNFASALRAVPRALDQYAQSLRLARSRGDVAARRQVGAAISQARDQAGEATSSYTALIDGAATADGAPLPPALAAELREAELLSLNISYESIRKITYFLVRSSSRSLRLPAWTSSRRSWTAAPATRPSSSATPSASGRSWDGGRSTTWTTSWPPPSPPGRRTRRAGTSADARAPRRPAVGGAPGSGRPAPVVGRATALGAAGREPTRPDRPRPGPASDLVEVRLRQLALAQLVEEVGRNYDRSCKGFGGKRL